MRTRTTRSMRTHPTRIPSQWSSDDALRHTPHSQRRHAIAPLTTHRLSLTLPLCLSVLLTRVYILPSHPPPFRPTVRVVRAPVCVVVAARTLAPRPPRVHLAHPPPTTRNRWTRRLRHSPRTSSRCSSTTRCAPLCSTSIKWPCSGICIRRITVTAWARAAREFIRLRLSLPFRFILRWRTRRRARPRQLRLQRRRHLRPARFSPS